MSDTPRAAADADADDAGMAALADALRQRIVPWMATQPRGHWRVVQLALERRGMLGRELRSMRAFARWLAGTFPELGDAERLASCMRKYKMTRGVRADTLERLPRGAELPEAVRLVEQRVAAD